MPSRAKGQRGNGMGGGFLSIPKASTTKAPDYTQNPNCTFPPWGTPRTGLWERLPVP